MAQAADVFNGFDLEILEKVGVGRVNAAGKHEILPDQEPVAVAEIVEHVFRVVTAAPNAEHVHVGVHGAFQQPLQHRFGDTRGQRIGWNPVGALGEQAHAVDIEGEFLAPLIGILAKFDSAQADFVAFLVEDGFAVFQGHFHFVEGLRAITMWPPELRFGNFDGEIREVVAIAQRKQIFFGFEFLATGAGHR